MTPTEQDKELREKVASIIEYWDFSPLQDEDSRIERLKNEILQLITADRKRVELEARLDELKRLQRLSVYTENVHQKINRVVSTRLNSLAELKAQQEEV